jgi:hypothetical protein
MVKLNKKDSVKVGLLIMVFFMIIIIQYIIATAFITTSINNQETEGCNFHVCANEEFMYVDNEREICVFGDALDEFYCTGEE